MPRNHMAVWFNSRPKAGLVSEAKLLRHIEVESLPAGGWGHNYLPYVGRLARTLGVPALSINGSALSTPTSKTGALCERWPDLCRSRRCSGRWPRRLARA